MNNLKPIPPFKGWVIQNFPFIEADFDAITNYQLYCKVVEYLNKVIANENELTTAMNYVLNYFNNLDVQDEINKKLDEMAEDGTLNEMITEYINLKSLLMYNTVSDLKNATNLISGSFAKTLGYNTKGDFGGGTYFIREITNQDVIDEGKIIALNNFPTLVADLVIENSTISVDQYGAKGDGTTDDTDIIQTVIDYATSHNLTCLFNNKVYKTSEPLKIKETSVLSGITTNDEYFKGAIIRNTDSNMIDIDSNIVGAHILNLCFESDNSKELYFINNTTYALEWCELLNIGFRKFYKVFNALTLGCRFEKLWINYGKSMGKLGGSDNVIKDCFISGPNANNDDLLILDGYSLSRLDNLYFTGKTSNETGNNNIVNIGGYCNNLSFNGCYFDFSNGSGVNILGSGNDFPNSGASNISFNNCLFRGNCCNQNEVTHVINADLCRNINIINCSFNNQDRYVVNENSKIYNLGQYAQGVLLLNNLYLIPFSYTNNYVYNASILEPYAPAQYNNFGIQYNQGITYLKNRLNNEIKTFKIRDNYTTDGTYGAITINFPENMGDNPIVNVNVFGSTYIACINNITPTSVQLIIRNVNSGTPIVNTNVNISLQVSNM